MILIHKEAYEESKLIKQVGGALDPPFQELSDWIFGRYRIRVLNLRYEHVDLIDRSRLHVICDRMEDATKFRSTDSRNIDPHKAAEIIAAFNAQLRRQKAKRTFDTERMFLILNVFEVGARIEANEQITFEAREQLSKKLGLWRIETFSDQVVFFVDTESEAKHSLVNGTAEKCAQAYARLLAPFDEFGYLHSNPLHIRFDSREIFHKHYNDSWWNYWK